MADQILFKMAVIVVILRNVIYQLKISIKLFYDENDFEC